MNTSSSFLQQLIHPLKESPHIQLTHCRKHPPLSDDQIRFFEELNQVSLPPIYVSLLRETNGLELRWKFANPLPDSTKFPDVALLSDVDGCLNISPLEPNRQLTSASHCIFEKINDHFTGALLKSHDKLDVIFGNPSAGSQKISLEHYLFFLIASKGFLPWRHHWFAHKNKSFRILPDKAFWENFKLSLQLPELIHQFPLCDQPGSPPSGIRRSLIYRLAQNGKRITSRQKEIIQNQHLEFLSSGGAGGKWQILQIQGITTAIYVKKGKVAGKQASFEHSRIPERVSFKKTTFPFTNFCGAYAPTIDFSESELSYSVFIDAFLPQANFEHAALQHVDFSRANLQGTSFKNANLEHCDFEQCNLEHADFSGANLRNSRFPGAFLNDVTC